MEKDSYVVFNPPCTHCGWGVESTGYMTLKETKYKCTNKACGIISWRKLSPGNFNAECLNATMRDKVSLYGK